MTAWNDLVSKIYKENKGTKNADGKDFSLKDAMILAKKSYKSADKTKKSKKGGASAAPAPVSATHTAAPVVTAPAVTAVTAPAVAKGGRRHKKSSSKKRSSKRKTKTAKKSRKSRK